MKRMFAILLSAVLLLGLLPGCSVSCPASPSDPLVSDPMPTEAAPLTADGLASLILPRSGCEDAENTETLSASIDGERLVVYLENAYGLEAGSWEDAAVIRATGASAFEVAALRLEDEDGAVRAAIALHNYMTARQGDFAGYAPAEVDMIANGGIRQIGPWLGLFICPDPEGAERAFEAELNGAELPAQSGGTSEPAIASFRIAQLVERLVVEAACPEWFDVKCRAMGESGCNWEYQIEEKYGIACDRYQKYALMWWNPSHDRDDHCVLLDCDYEVAAFQAESEAAAGELVNTLNSYLEEKEARLRKEGRTDAAELVHSGQAAQVGPYALLAVCDHTEETIQCFHQAVYSKDTQDYYDHAWEEWRAAASAEPEPSSPGFDVGSSDYDPNYPDRIKFVDPGKDDMSLYDTSAIRAAWAAGDPSGLSNYDRATYDAAEAVLDEIVTDGMSDLEKETAIYSWIVNSVDYDWTHQDVMAATPRKSFEPYGGLVDRTAVCLGYATSFQLLCDLAGVECITVAGAAFHSEEDHGWNMVRLNGKWYCVDVTWDANYREYGSTKGGEDEWIWFNVTSDEMARSHQWDYANTPEATAKDHGRG